MKKINLKVQGSSYNGFNVYQNVNTFGKVFNLGIKKEKLTNEFIKNYISEINKKYTYTHYNVGIKIDFVLSELSFFLDNVFERIIKKLKSNVYGNEFPKYVESIEKVFPFIKENIYGIYKNSIHLKSYWGYHTPNDLHGRLNNSEVGKILSRSYGDYIDAIKNENQENRIFGNENIEFVDEIAQIFPGENYNKEASTGSIPVKYLDDKKEKEMNEISDSIYDYFIDNDMEDFVSSMRKFVEEEKGSALQNMAFGKKEEKDIFIKFFLLYQSKFESFVYDSYFKKSSIFGLDYYLYENQYFLDLNDIVFTGEYVERTKGQFVLKNKTSLDMIKNILIDGLKDGFYDQYVMKLTYYFEDENGENFQIEHVGESLYKISDGKMTNYVELEESEVNALESLGSLGRKKVRWGITLGLYGQKLEKIKEFKNIFSGHMKNAGYDIFFKQGGGDNIFEHNNYLFQTNMVKTCTNLCLSANIKEFFELMPGITKNDEDGIYLGIDWYSKQPIIKQPYSQTDAKNIISVGSSGSGKTMFMQQLVCTNIKDKFFILDPTGTFAQLGKLTKDVEVKDLFDLDFNPIALDKEFYSSFGVDWKIPKTEKVKLVMLLLGVEKLQITEDFKTTLKLIIDNIYDEHDLVTIEVIQKTILEIYNTGKYPEFLEGSLGKNKFDKNISSQFGGILRVILDLKGDGIIYDFLNKKKDFTRLFAESTKLVIDLQQLGLVNKDKLNDRDKIIFLYLLQNILTYLSFNAKFVKDKKDKLGKSVFPRHYIIIDEIHLLFKEEDLRKLYIIILRTIRNRLGQITGLSQAVSDFAFSMDDGGTGSELDILNQNHIKFFYQESDILSYISILNKSYGMKKGKEEDGGDEEPIKLKQLKFYYNEFSQIKKDNSEENGGRGPRLMLVEYYGEFFLCSPQISQVFIDNMEILKT